MEYLIKAGEVWKNRLGDIVRTVKVDPADRKLLNVIIIKNNSKSEYMNTSRGSGVQCSYNFWTKSGSRLFGNITRDELLNNKKYHRNYDLIEKLDPEEYPEYYL